jgi:hypothetical protein
LAEAPTIRIQPDQNQQRSQAELRIYESTNLRIYESTNLRIYESTNLRIYESTNLRIYESTNARPDVLRSPDRSPRKSIASLPFLTGESNKPNDWNLSLRLKWRNCFPSSTKKARRNFQSPLALLAIRPVVVGMAHCLTAKRLPTPDIEGILSCRDSLPFPFSCSRSEC